MLGSAESRDPKLIFEEFQPMRSRNLNVTDGQTELAVAIRAIKQCYICIFYNLMLWTLDNQLVSAVDRFRHNILSVSILYYVTSIVFLVKKCVCSVQVIHRVSEKNKHNYFCYNYVKLPSNLIIFGTKMGHGT